MRLLALGLACALAWAQPALERSPREQDPSALGIGRLIPDIDLLPMTGTPTTLARAAAASRTLVVVMTSTSCPVSVRVAPKLAALEAELAPRGVSFVFVNTVRAEADADMRRHIKEAGFKGLYLPDRTGAVARHVAARTTTEAFVLDPARTLRYRGAIDDQDRVGGVSDTPTRHYLREAVLAVLGRERPPIAATWAPGCLLDAPDRVPLPAGELTYSNRIARILADHCVDCHRADGPSPFALDHYGAVLARAAMIEAVVRDDLMPPTHGLRHRLDPDGRRLWSRDRTLGAADKRDLLAWLASTRPLGDIAESPRPVETPQTWAIGLPDAVFATPEVAIPASGPARRERLVIDPRLASQRFITALECRPMMPGTVQDALVWLLPPGVDAGADPVPHQARLLAAYSPGEGLVSWPDGMGMLIPPGSRFVVDLVARPMGRPMRASLRVAVRFADDVPIAVCSTPTSGAPFDLAPGARADVAWDAGPTIREPISLLAITPVLGPRAVAARVESITPDGATATWLDLSRYDARWRIRYAPTEPWRLLPGAILRVTVSFDNTSANPLNPDANARVRIGERAEPLMLHLETDAPTPPILPASPR